MIPHKLTLLLALHAAIGVHGVKATNIAVGDKIVTIARASVQVGRETLAMVDAGLELVATNVQGPWIAVTVSHEGKSLAGWIHKERLVSVGSRSTSPTSVLIPSKFHGVWATEDGSGRPRKFADGSAVELLLVSKDYLIWVQNARADDVQVRTVSQPADWTFQEWLGILRFAGTESMGVNLATGKAITRDADVSLQKQGDVLMLRTRGEAVEAVREEPRAVAPGRAIVISPSYSIEAAIVAGARPHVFVKLKDSR